ncbi:MAG: fatty acid desaturase [Saprospiraceae bacterium]|nr:fatty acid desaturase [Saprospiraceae bacterium]MCB0625110.1 fatty acid desaturase [Saprospiraceae bacterium]MCB0677427.1 fatty acid desaturase [Saprospiraceae bacterium]MCB0681664.1 fatty acid desaturase [Saprospiraceae bacterium]
MKDEQIKRDLQHWLKIVTKYQQPSRRKAVIQILNSFLPFLGLWILMYFSLEWSYWITLGLAVINAFFLVRIFIIQHDCGHNSFFKWKKLNDVVGLACSFFSSIPYKYWARSHSFHHAHNGQLEVRDIGDIHTLTVEEYRALPRLKRLGYRLFRNPLVMFVFGPIYYLLVPLRLPMITLDGWRTVKWAQLYNNVYLLLAYAILIFAIGWKKFFLVHVPIVVIFGIIAIWFFYVQHQHEQTYKQWKDNWDYLLSSIRGSTYFKLPRLFQWLTGNIGFHHIHHLNSKIPNYHLEWCARENPIFQKHVTTITFWQSLRCMFHHLWDEESQRMISFWTFYRMERQRVLVTR